MLHALLNLLRFPLDAPYIEHFVSLCNEQTDINPCSIGSSTGRM